MTFGGGNPLLKMRKNFVKSLLELVAKQLICFQFPFHDLTKATKEKFSEMKRSGMHRMATSGITDNKALSIEND